MSINIVYRLASTAFIASAAELVIPPVYPEPSPIGYRFFIFTDSYFSLRLILTGEDVLVSAPNNIVWSETNSGYSPLDRSITPLPFSFFPVEHLVRLH